MNNIYVLTLVLSAILAKCNGNSPLDEMAISYYEQNSTVFSEIYRASNKIEYNIQIGYQRQISDTFLLFQSNDLNYEETVTSLNIDSAFSGSIKSALDSLGHLSDNWMASISLYDGPLKNILQREHSELTDNLENLLSINCPENMNGIRKHQDIVTLITLNQDKIIEYYIYHDPAFELLEKEEGTVYSEIYKSDIELKYQTGRINDSIVYRALKD